MIRCKIFLISIIFLLTINCEEKKSGCWDIGKPCGNMFFYFNIIKPREDRARSCTLENSINLSGRMDSNYECINDLVSNQIIFDITNNKLVNTLTINSGIVVRCLCPNQTVPYSVKWSKGNELNLETFPPNVPISLITINNSLNTNEYQNGTNLFCINTCIESNRQYINRYQILKLRSNP